MPSGPGSGSSNDHGLGPEIIDQGTVLADTYTDERAAAALQKKRARGLAYWVLATVALVLMGEQTSLSFVLYTPVIAKVAAVFHTKQIVWMLTAFTVASIGFTPIMTRLCDVYGKKRILVIAAGITTLGCLICALAPNFSILLAGRVLMSASFTFAPLTVALMREVFPTRMRAVAIGLATNGIGVVAVGGPLLGGYVATAFGIRAVFWANLILAAVSGLLVLLSVPESPLRARTRIDYVGAVLLAIALPALLVGLTEIPTLGIGNPITLVCIIGGVLVAFAWWKQQKVTAQPLISIKLIKQRTIAMTFVAVVVFSGVAGAMNYLVALAWAAPKGSTTYGHGLNPLQLGIWTVPLGVLTVLGGLFVGITIRSIGLRLNLVIAGFFWVVPAILLGVFLNSSPALLIAIYGLLGLGNMYLASTAGLIVVASPGDQRGVVQGMTYAMHGIGPSIVPQIMAIILGGSIASVVGGVPVYEASGFRTAFVVAGLIAVLGIAASLAVTHGRRVRNTSNVAVTELESQVRT